MAKVEMWKTCGVAIGLLLLLFVAGLVATSQYNSDVFAPNFRGRKLDTQTVSSTLSQAAPAGSSQIYLASAVGFAVGQQIEIDSGSTAPAQRHNVTQVISTASALMIAPATQREHVVGASVRTTHTQSSSFNSFDSISGSDFSQSMRSSESGSSMGDLKATYAWFFGIFGVTWGHIQIVFIVIYACIYKNHVVDVQGQMPEGLSHSTHALEPGLLDCLCDCGMCHIVLYCPFIRAAQNNYAADICGYWETFAIMWLSTFCLACGAPLCLNVLFRMHIKEHMGLEDDCFTDCVISFFCYHCSLGQQALAIDQAMGYKFKCPCTLTAVDSPSKAKHYHRHHGQDQNLS